ncbi:MAG: hypothetical protein ACE5IW_07415 [bacterium]
MKTRRKLIPGQPGTKKWVEKYGENLICVRYRYDSERKRKIKTVELIVEEGPWEADSRRIPNNKIVYVRIKYNEIYLRKVVKGAGGRWNKEKKLWELPYGEVKQLGFTDRMVVA